MRTDRALLSQEIAALDSNIACLAPEIWVGAEPTFTLRTSEAPEWLSEPLGGEKERLARRLVSALRERRPGAIVLRTLGRQYPGEKLPRWSIGILEAREGLPLWQGPPDPLDNPVPPCTDSQISELRDNLITSLSARRWQVRALAPTAGDVTARLLCRIDDVALPDTESADPRWSRLSIHGQAVPLSGLVDRLAAEGLLLIAISREESIAGKGCTVVELPAFPDVTSFRVLLEVLADAAADLPALILRGFPPPVDDSVAWTTVTPDPAVIEINQAPCPDSTRFLAASREIYEVSAAIGLSPYRMQYNGTVSDSGGGGQFTLGGSSPDTSPFLVQPRLLSRLVRYVIRHPSLSYSFAPDYLGGSSQSPRPDEGVRESFRELGLALAQVERQQNPAPEFIWRSLAPFLADPSGNSHRSDLNIEKFWNPYLPDRGRLGLVEFRAFRMTHTPERAAAISALLRAVVAMLSIHDLSPDLTDWGDELHERFALPYYLRRDLLSIFADLSDTGFELGAEVRRILEHDAGRSRWEVEFEGCRLTIEKALEFWPLVGDVASQERGGSRLVDASTSRWQLLLRPPAKGDPEYFRCWRLVVDGMRLPLRYERDETGELGLIGLRLREFQPWIGLHPAVSPHMPLTLTMMHPRVAQALNLQLHDWQPDGLPYNGLPVDLGAAQARREERLTSTVVPTETLAKSSAPPAECLTDYTLDLRWLMDRRP